MTDETHRPELDDETRAELEAERAAEDRSRIGELTDEQLTAETDDLA